MGWLTWPQSGQSGSAACATAADVTTAHAANNRPTIVLDMCPFTPSQS